MAYSKQNFQDGQILNAANLEAMENGIIAGQGAKNLLINSNFKDPINSSGKTNWSSSGITIDKWRTYSAVTVNLTSSGITVNATSVAGNFQQNIDNLPNGTYTFAALVNDVIRTRVFTNNNGTIATVDNSNAAFGGSGYLSTGKGSGAYYVQIVNVQGYTNTIAWAALYEGNYTADTLPDYVPKDKHIEMLNCGASLQPNNILDNSDFRDPVNHNGQSEYSGYLAYTIDRWFIATYNTKVTVQSGSVKATTITGSSYANISQKITNATRYAGKTLTLAAYVQSNVVPRIIILNGDTSIASKEGTSGSYQLLVCNFTVPANIADGALSIRIQSRSTQENDYVTVQWAALYEGAYTAETLPPYIPKGKHIEMLNCGVPLAPRNLLDNSDMPNAINHRGQSSYTGQVYGIDRWYGRVAAQTVSVRSTDVTVTATGTSYPAIKQKVVEMSKLAGKTVTFAAKIYANVAPELAFFNASDKSLAVKIGTANATQTIVMTYTIPSDATTDSVIPTIMLRTSASGDYMRIYWVVLYEGAYDASTLPPYIPKGKHVEMLNCNVPLTPHNLLDNSDFRNPVNQRGIQSGASITEYTYCLDRWMNFGATAGTLTLSENGISFTMTNLNQRLPETIKTGTVVTAVAKWNDGTIVTVTGEITRGNAWTWFTAANNGHQIGVIDMGNNKEAHFTIMGGSGVVEWAALYEGSYDASTLPAYQPKGYAAELAECMRYYRRFINSAPAMSIAATAIEAEMPLEPPMRVVPTITINSVGPAYTPEGTKSLSGSYSATNTVNKAGYVFYTPSIGIGLPCIITGIDGYLSADL